MRRDDSDLVRKPQPLALYGLFITGTIAGGLLGAATNAVNGAVSPTYFAHVMGWHGFPNLWLAAIAQGIGEGLVFSFLFAVVLAIGTGLITGASCSFGFALRHLGYALAGALACWAIGGSAAMGLASLHPELYRSAFIGVPHSLKEVLSYAWVHGSLLGVEWGGGASVLLALVLVRANWRRESDRLA